jgi:hypothetical protein
MSSYHRGCCAALTQAFAQPVVIAPYDPPKKDQVLLGARSYALG